MDNNDTSADRLTFWRNWYTAARQLPDDLRLAWLDAVLDFAFDGKEPTTGESIAAAIGFQAVQMVRATIEISRKRKESGSKGGASKKQTASKPQANCKQKRSKAKADPKQVKEQVKEQEQEHNANSYTATIRKPPTIDQFIAGGELAGVPADFARQLHKDLTEAGWRDSAGQCVGNWRRYLKSAWNAEQKKIRAARVSGDDAFGGIPVGRV